MLNTREIELKDIPHIAAYWNDASDEYLLGMGADPAKMPAAKYWEEALSKQVKQSYEEKKAYAIIWEIDGKAVGHCNLNMIEFGKQAHMHLHFWTADNRRKGMGQELLKKSIPYFFKNMQLQVLYCEPYALNPAPNKTLPKVGFEFVKNYRTTPGSINLEQEVNKYKMTIDQYQNLYS